MNTPRKPAADEAADAPPKVSRKIAAEAGVWVARLHGPSRSRQMELDCLAWQARSAAHRHAFECCTDVWMEVPGVPLERIQAAVAAYAPDEGFGAQARARSRIGRRGGLLALCLGLVVLGGGAALVWRDEGYRTGVGESQSVVLSDGTRMTLNTDTRLRLDFSGAQRTVKIERGEAVFEVAKDARRPFVVRAASSEVVAVGTVFAVHLTPPESGSGAGEALAVTLLEGQVSLRPAASAKAGEVAPQQPVLMQPGERVRLTRPSPQQPATIQVVDRPRIDQLMAWRRSEAVFDNATLGEAVAEMNRYSRKPLVLMNDLAAAPLRVSGQFSAGDSAGFAQALASLHGLTVNERSGRLELSRKP